MTAIPSSFPAFVAERVDDRVVRGVRSFEAADLPSGEVYVRIDWSSVNYKDALATIADGKVARISPLIPGIDLAGEVMRLRRQERAGRDGGGRPRLRPGRRPPRRLWRLHPGPGGLRRPVAAGARRLATRWRSGRPASPLRCVSPPWSATGSRPATGPVLVTGASGGVGSVAVAILAARGHEVWAATGKSDEEPRLRTLGAVGIVAARRGAPPRARRPLESARWAGAVDTVGVGDAAVRAADPPSGRRRRIVRQRRRREARNDRPARSSCAASRCSAWTRRTCRSRSDARSGAGSRRTSGRAASDEGTRGS